MQMRNHDGLSRLESQQCCMLLLQPQLVCLAAENVRRGQRFVASIRSRVRAHGFSHSLGAIPP
jgi:hypothetical protein